ncbi:hypothetical protein [Rummeliibacillus stabekisii]|uniref:Uncharacterized protein n=1 Tax=Rummeliibacillus stabekisii TaxID=241244 RepID=A0A143HCW3_9BACL|nr:hypothetical protein [Rummeliibacillus stabekisii]AMW99325.1 hypothetical protein ATY39_07520 [Rummeliibacillus stabekisii]
MIKMEEQMNIYEVFQEQDDIMAIQKKISRLQKPGQRIVTDSATITKASRFFDVKSGPWHEIIYTPDSVVDFLSRTLEGRISGRTEGTL